MVAHLRFWFVVLLFWMIIPAHAQFNDPSLQQITVEQGLSQSSVYSILQDYKGFLWFGTADGLNRYDGYDITVFRHRDTDTNSLTDNTIRTMIEDKNHSLWVATNEALHRYDRISGHFIHYPIATVEALLVDDGGTLWIGASHGLYYRYPASDSFHPFQYPSTHETKQDHRAVKSLFQDRNGRLWIGTDDGMDIIDPTTGSLMCLSDKFHATPASAAVQILSMTEDRHGSIWCATWGKGLMKIIQTADSMTVLPVLLSTKNTLAISFTASLSWLNDTTLWVATGTNGVVQYSTTAQAYSLISQPTIVGNQFRTKNARFLFRDRSGIYWIGTDGDGIYKYNPKPKKFRHLFAGDPPGNRLSGNFLRSVIEDRHHRVWIGTYEHGITLWDKSTNQFTPYLNTPMSDQHAKGMTVYTICEDRSGTIWIGTTNGLMRFDEHRREFLPVHLSFRTSSPEIMLLSLSHTGKLWLCFRSGLFSFDPVTHELNNMEFDQSGYPTIRSGSIRCLYEDNAGILWVGSYRGGLTRLDIKNRQSRTYTYDAHNPQSISHDMVNSVCPGGDNTLWIGTEHGFNRFDTHNGIFTRFLEEDGIPNAFIYDILRDHHNNLWISTNKGISRFTPETKIFRNYGLEDGLQSNEFNSGTSFQTPDGLMYFGGINGLNYFYPDSVRDNPIVPQLAITGVKILDIPLSQKGDPSELQELPLNYEDGIFSIRFSALEFSRPEKNMYAYYLEGFEKNWIYCGTKHEIRYTHMDPGTYIFHVKGSNNDGVWNEEGISLRIVIVPPFWRTWWFISLVSITLLVSIGGAVRFFERRKLQRHLLELEHEREMERVRSRISQDMHDEIGANLTKIAIMSELARRDIGDRTAMENHLQKISTNARDIIDSISEIVWAINPKNDRLENLVAFIREYTSGFFEGTEIHNRFHIPDMIPEFPLSGEERRNILLVVKEALNNIAKHSGARQVVLRLSVEHDLFVMQIQDDGNGFSLDAITEFGNGLHNMKKRMESISGKCEIYSRPGEGTQITLSLPLHGDKIEGSKIPPFGD